MEPFPVASGSNSGERVADAATRCFIVLSKDVGNVACEGTEEYSFRMVVNKLSVFLLLATLALAQQSPAPSGSEPTLPVIDYNACPFEGCTFGKWKVTKQSTVYSSWRERRTEIARIKPGDGVLGLTGVHITRRPDRILVKAAIPNMELKPGDVILRYMYLGEGFANIWYNGAWHKESDCTFVTEKGGGGCSRDCSAVVTEEGVKDWWVKIKTPAGTVGWVLVDENFDGMDSLG
jgi:hypothetical protein